MKKYLLVIAALCLVVGALLPLKPALGATNEAVLYVSGACGPVYNGTNLTFDIHVNSYQNDINAVQANLNYTSSQFNVVSVTAASDWSEVQNDTSTPGTILFAAFPNPPGSTENGDNVIATVVLQAKVATGTATVSFNEGTSAVTLGDGSAQDILTSTIGGTYHQTLAHTCGSLVKASNNPTVYLIADGKKRPITTPAVFTSQGYNWDWISIMNANDAALTTGAAVPFRDGTLIKGSSSTVYVIDNTDGASKKRPISSLAVFTALGYTSQDIVTVPDAQLPSSGTAFSSTTVHPAGTLVKNTSNGSIYLIGSNEKHYIGSVQILYTYGYNSWQIKSATGGDLALANGTNLGLRPGLVVKGSSSSIYVTDSRSGVPQKRKINSMTVFNSLGYNSGQIIGVPDGSLPVVNGLSL